jgi:hypothetical protein
MKTFCNRCRLETDHNVLLETEKTVYFDPDDDFAINCYQIIECKGCNNIIYRTLTRDKISTEFSSVNGQSPWKLLERFPLNEKNHLKVKRRDNLPEKMNIILSETINSYNNGNFILCATGIRSIIESIYFDQVRLDGVNSWSLEKKIIQLAEKGILTKKNSSILHDLRFIGNKAIHQLRIPTENELRIGIEIIEITLDAIYQIESKGNDLKKSSNNNSKQ